MTYSRSGKVLDFLANSRQKIKSLKVYFSPKQAGEGTPSPENVREISGYDGVEVQHHGKNLCPSISEWSPGYIGGGGGNIVLPSNVMKEKYSDYILVNPNTTYWFSYKVISDGAKWASIACYDENKKFLRRPGLLTSQKFTTNSNEYYVRFSMRTYDAV